MVQSADAVTVDEKLHQLIAGINVITIHYCVSQQSIKLLYRYVFEEKHEHRPII